MRLEHWLYTIPLRLRSLFRWAQADQELDDELRDHLERKTEECVAQGMTREEALRRARLELGGVEKVKEECRDVRINCIQDLVQDVRFGLRMLRKSPGFTSVAILTLALSIGANTAIFSIVNAALLRPLPYPDSERLVTLWMTEHNPGLGPVSDPDYAEWKSQNKVFVEMAAFHADTKNLTGYGTPERLLGADVTASLFPLLGARAVLGKVFVAENQKAGYENVVVLSHRLWERRFGSDPAVIGKAIALDNTPYTVVGVMSAGFEFPNQSDFWAPLVLTNDHNASNQVVARLAPGVSLERAQSDWAVISARVDMVHKVGEAMRLVYLKDAMVSHVRYGLFVLLGAVGFVLLVGCANVAGLLLARSATRQREMAVRKALGADRGRIARQVLTESLLLSGVGGVLGVLIAGWGRDALVSIMPRTVASPGVLGRMVSISIDPWVLAFTAIISVVTGCVFGLAPALQAARRDSGAALKGSGAALGPGAALGNARGLFVMGEVALTVVLLVSAVLLIKSFLSLLEINPGFNPDNVLTMNLELPETKYQNESQMRSFHDAMLEKVSVLPGVKSAGTVSFGLPMTGSGLTGDFTIAGRPPSPHDYARKLVVSPGYFKTLAIPLVKGRFFEWADGPDSQPVAVVSESFARRVLPDGNVLGHKVQVFEGTPWYSIVGIAGDVRQSSLGMEPPLNIYFPYDQAPRSFLMNSISLVVRTGEAPTTMTNAIRKAVQSADPEMPVFDVASMEELVSASISEPHFNALLLGSFAALALILATVGVYGNVSYSATQQRHEIGIRMALGAQRGDILRMVVGQGITLALLGVAIGIAGALALTRFLASLLYGVKPTDSFTFAAVSLILTSVAVLASYIPAARAMKVDPMVALRYE
jgi:putative ABC transport system permease protein